MDVLPPDTDRGTLMDTQGFISFTQDNKIFTNSAPLLSPSEIANTMKLPENPNDNKAIRNIIYDNIQAFSASDADIGTFTEWKAELPVDTSRPPAFSKQFPTPMEHTKILVAWMERMIANNIIARAPQSPCQSPIFIIPKAEPNRLRVVQDCRKLNQAIPEEQIQSKPIHQVIREVQLSGADTFSVLDIS